MAYRCEAPEIVRIPVKSARYSDLSRPAIPEQSVQRSERSDAGVNMIE